MFDNITGQNQANIFILNNNNKSITYLKDELIYKIDWFDNRNIISTIKHFTYMLESSPFINKFEDHMIKYLNNQREQIINLLTSLVPKISNDKFIDQQQLKLELKLSTKIRLINNLTNNCTFFANSKVYTNETRLNLIKENNQLANELSKLNIINKKEPQIEIKLNQDTNQNSNPDDYSITDISNNKCDLIYPKNQTINDSNNNLIQSTSNNSIPTTSQNSSIQTISHDSSIPTISHDNSIPTTSNNDKSIDDDKNDYSLFNLTNVMMNMDDFTFLKDNRINSQIDLINLNNLLKENDQLIESIEDNSRRKFKKLNDTTVSQNSERKTKNKLNDDEDVENHLKSHYTISEGEFVTLEEVYDTFMENFEVHKHKNSIKSSIGKCIKKLFNNNGQIKVLNKVIDGKARSIYFNLKAI